MKRVLLAQDLVPAKEFRSNMASWLNRVSTSDRPVVITQHGKAAAVLMSPEAADELEQQRDVLRHVLQGLNDIDEGRLHDDDDVWAAVDDLIAGADDANPLE